VIADEVWAKLMWAGLNLQANDLPLHATTGGEPWYPLELVRAVAMLWLFSGLRTDEIMRLRVGAIRWEKQHDADESSERRVSPKLQLKIVAFALVLPTFAWAVGCLALGYVSWGTRSLISASARACSSVGVLSWGKVASVPLTRIVLRVRFSSSPKRLLMV